MNYCICITKDHLKYTFNLLLLKFNHFSTLILLRKQSKAKFSLLRRSLSSFPSPAIRNCCATFFSEPAVAKQRRLSPSYCRRWSLSTLIYINALGGYCRHGLNNCQSMIIGPIKSSSQHMKWLEHLPGSPYIGGIKRCQSMWVHGKIIHLLHWVNKSTLPNFDFPLRSGLKFSSPAILQKQKRVDKYTTI